MNKELLKGKSDIDLEEQPISQPVSPLAESVRLEALERGENLHETADRVSIRNAPLATLPPALRTAREKVLRAAGAVETAEAEESQIRHQIQEYKNLLLETQEQQNRVYGDEACLARCRQDCAALEHDVELIRNNLGTSDGFTQAIDRTNSAVIAEKLIGPVSKRLAKNRERLEVLQAEVRKLSPKFAGI
jgi:hypothetical protein